MSGREKDELTWLSWELYPEEYGRHIIGVYGLKRLRLLLRRWAAVGGSTPCGPSVYVFCVAVVPRMSFFCVFQTHLPFRTLLDSPLFLKAGFDVLFLKWLIPRYLRESRYLTWRRKWRIPRTAEPGGLPSLGSHRVGHDWSDLAAATADILPISNLIPCCQRTSSVKFQSFDIYWDFMTQPLTCLTECSICTCKDFILFCSFWL